MSVTINDLGGLGGTPLDANESTDAGTSMAAAGASFGELIKGVGNAVAATQLKLTENSAETTSKLASTLVDVIAVQETVIDDAGTVRESKSHVQKLPLLNFVDPVFYQYPQVKVEGHFVIDSFATDTAAHVDSSSSTFGMGFSFSKTPILFGLFSQTSSQGGLGFTNQSQNANLNTQSNQSVAVGRMRLYSQLQPDSAVGVPKPVQVIVGPSLSILEGEIAEEDDDDGNTTRTMSLLIQYRDKSGNPIKGKALSIDTEGVLWNFTDPDKTVTGDTAPDEGNLAIQLKRIFPASTDPEAPPVDKSPKPATINVRKGLVATGVTVTF